MQKNIRIWAALSLITASASITGEAVNNYVLGKSKANEPHTLVVKIDGVTEEHTVIFGEVITNGGGMENVSWQVSFVPYLPTEDEE